MSRPTRRANGSLGRVRILDHIVIKRFQHEVVAFLLGIVALALVTAVSSHFHFRLAAISLLCVIVVVLVARVGRFVSSIAVSVIAASYLVYSASPVRTFRIGEALDVAAIVTFLVTSLVIAGLVSRLRTMANEARSTVNRRLIDAEERERTRIARELHDDINQRMALLAMNLDKLTQGSVDQPTELRQQIAEIRNQVRDLGKDINAVSHRLHSSKLEILGLASAAASLCSELSDRQEVEIEFHSENIPTGLPEETSICLFRVLQEALQNAISHSGSRKFQVSLKGDSIGIELLVHDSGTGFDPEEAVKGRGLGLTSMRERLKLVSGDLSIDSEPPRGTTVRARVPHTPTSV